MKVILFLVLAVTALAIHSVHADKCNAAVPTSLTAGHTQIDTKKRMNLEWDANGVSEGACWQVQVKPIGQEENGWTNLKRCTKRTALSLKRSKFDKKFPNGYPGGKSWSDTDFTVRVRSRINDMDNCEVKTVKGEWSASVVSAFNIAMASYTVKYESQWSAKNFPDDFPEGSQHFSGLIGATHNKKVVFWNAGKLASDGIKSMAETGSKTTLQGEVEDEIDSGTAEYLLSGNGLPTSPDSTTYNFDISSTHPLVTLVSMIAPSPDWFVGVHGLSLWQDGEWVEKLEVELYGYDAGTDSGESYKSSNDPTSPPDAIEMITSGPLADGEYVGMFTFELQ
eukprot:TRINITY_DN17466_c0_g1_i1.p1 TRINITY_DN17466_c0_g1~~TRINITY_DN17466_c0_g1_i1.p1  ORF type:complete len:337 (-),score=78.78 TRINITY_DN17466_c0_g1_i1:55-1065(-)